MSAEIQVILVFAILILGVLSLMKQSDHSGRK